MQTANTPATETQSQAISSLRSLVEDIDANMLAAKVSEGFAGNGFDSDCGDDKKALKRSSASMAVKTWTLFLVPVSKRQRK